MIAELRGVTKTYGSVVALDNVSLALEAGRVTAILGPNGAGKTSTIRLLLGLTRPTRGTVSLFGTDPRSADCAAAHRGHAADREGARDADRARARASLQQLLPITHDRRGYAGGGGADRSRRSEVRPPVRRTASARAIRARHLRQPGPAVPRRADGRPRRRVAARILAAGPPARLGRPDHRADHALPRGSRRARRSRRDAERGLDRRRWRAARDQVARRVATHPLRDGAARRRDRSARRASRASGATARPPRS